MSILEKMNTRYSVKFKHPVVAEISCTTGACHTVVKMHMRYVKGDNVSFIAQHILFELACDHLFAGANSTPPRDARRAVECQGLLDQETKGMIFDGHIGPLKFAYSGHDAAIIEHCPAVFTDNIMGKLLREARAIGLIDDKESQHCHANCAAQGLQLLDPATKNNSTRRSFNHAGLYLQSKNRQPEPVKELLPVFYETAVEIIEKDLPLEYRASKRQQAAARALSPKVG